MNRQQAAIEPPAVTARPAQPGAPICDVDAPRWAGSGEGAAGTATGVAQWPLRARRLSNADRRRRLPATRSSSAQPAKQSPPIVRRSRSRAPRPRPRPPPRAGLESARRHQRSATADWQDAEELFRANHDPIVRLLQVRTWRLARVRRGRLRARVAAAPAPPSRRRSTRRLALHRRQARSLRTTGTHPQGDRR